MILGEEKAGTQSGKRALIFLRNPFLGIEVRCHMVKSPVGENRFIAYVKGEPHGSVADDVGIATYGRSKVAVAG